MNPKLSIIIPSRNEFFLQKAVDDILAKAEDEIEIIVVLDGLWQQLRDDPRLIVIHHGVAHDSRGMRESINTGMAMARGEYVMKIDGHCMVDQGFDVKLVAEYEKLVEEGRRNASA